MKKCLVIICLILMSVPAYAGAVATQRVKIIVERIAEIDVYGNPEIYLNAAKKYMEEEPEMMR